MEDFLDQTERILLSSFKVWKMFMLMGYISVEFISFLSWVSKGTGVAQSI